jgi:hypothetical protein
LIKADQWLIEPHELASNRLVVLEDDVHQLKTYAEMLQHSVGIPVAIQGTDFSDVWCALEFISQSQGNSGDSVCLSQIKNNMAVIIQQVTALQDQFASVHPIIQAASTTQNKLSQMLLTLEKHEKRFCLIQPMLLNIGKLTQDVATLMTRTSTTTQQPVSATTDPWSASFAPTPDMDPSLPPHASALVGVDTITRLHTMENIIKSLEKRIVGDGIKIGRFLFQSKEDLQLWLAAHVPNNRFGLFLDAVSIFDFLAQPHLDNQENVAQLYNSQKNGFNTTYESRIISSMQNLFPNLFGKSSSDGMDTAQALPGLTKVEQWNNKGVTSLQLQVKRELLNVDLQFRNAISSTFEDSAEARDLALELLYRSKKIALDLCNFIQRDYEF